MRYKNFRDRQQSGFWLHVTTIAPLILAIAGAATGHGWLILVAAAIAFTVALVGGIARFLWNREDDRAFDFDDWLADHVATRQAIATALEKKRQRETGVPSCRFSSGDPLLKCAVNPLGECDRCVEFEHRR
jgi:Family of unknown function (DUF6464)